MKKKVSLVFLMLLFILTACSNDNSVADTGNGSGIHIFHDGYHGMSVGNNAPGESLENSSHPSADMWVPLCVNWLNDLFSS